MRLARAVIVPVRGDIASNWMLLTIVFACATTIGTLIHYRGAPTSSRAVLQPIDRHPPRAPKEVVAASGANVLVEYAFPDWVATQRRCPDQISDLAKGPARVDPWGTDYAVLCGQTPGGLRVRIVSAGADQVFGTADDVWSRWR